MADDRDARIAELEAELREARAELQRSNCQRDTALEQQTATAEILRATDASVVLQSIVEIAARLCGTDNVGLERVVGNELVRAASTRLAAGVLAAGERRPLSADGWIG